MRKEKKTLIKKLFIKLTTCKNELGSFINIFH